MPEKQTTTTRKKKREDPQFPEGRPTWEIARLFPVQGAWTEDDYLGLDGLHEGFPLLELSNGRLEVVTMPTQSHQLIVIFLLEMLKAFTAVHAPGVVLIAAMKVRLKDGKRPRYREPDVFYMKAEHAHRRHEQFWEGADLVMEVVSSDPKDRRRDLVIKPREYAAAKIPEYWIIDPELRLIRVLTLEGTTYKTHGEFGPGTMATSVLLPGFAVSVDAMLAPLEASNLLERPRDWGQPRHSSMNSSSLVLVTGSAGRIGQAVVRELKARGRTVRGLDLVSTPGADDCIVADITNSEAVHRAMEGVGALVHLAATPDDDDFLTKLLPNNVVGVYHVLEAARGAGVKRVVLASSGQVVWWQRFSGPFPIGIDAAPTPRGWYAATKLFQEAAGRAYAEAHGMSVIAVRLGWCPRTSQHVRELAGTDWGPDVYLSPGDAGRFFACAVEAAPELRFVLVYACSRPVRRMVYDLVPTRQLLGYEPRDTWPEGIEQDT